jgi:hypothetical protein
LLTFLIHSFKTTKNLFVLGKTIDLLNRKSIEEFSEGSRWINYGPAKSSKHEKSFGAIINLEPTIGRPKTNFYRLKTKSKTPKDVYSIIVKGELQVVALEETGKYVIIIQCV